MNNMKKRFLYLIIIILSSFFSINVLAANLNATIVTIFPNTTYLKHDYLRCSNKNTSTALTPCNSNATTETKRFSGIGVYGISRNGIKRNDTLTLRDTIQVYCIEPGTDLVTHPNASTYYEYKSDGSYSEITGDDLYTYQTRYFKGNKTNNNVLSNEDKINLMKAIFTFSRNPVVGFGPDKKNWIEKNRQYSINDWFDYDYTNSIYATQLLIWEIVDGERTSLASVKPDNTFKNSAYCKMFGCTGSIATTKIAQLDTRKNNNSLKSEYERIVNTARIFFGSEGKIKKSVFHQKGVPDKYESSETSDGVIPKYEMLYNSSTGKYELRIPEDYAEYFKGIAPGLTITNNNNEIYISSSKPIDETLIEFKVSGFNQILDLSQSIYDGNKGGKYYTRKEASEENVYPADIRIYKSGENNSGNQDLISITPKYYSIFIKVYTPKYSIKIVKKEKINNTEQNINKETVFELYDTDKKTLITTLTTDRNTGEVQYDKLNHPGTYFIKEKKAPYGYKYNVINEEDSKIVVSSNNGVNNPAEKIIYNEPNKIDLIKYTIDEDTGEKIKSGNCDSNEPVFKILDGDTPLCFEKVSEKVYKYVNCSANNNTEIQTCEGEFSVEYIPGCENGKDDKTYEIVEMSAGGARITNRSETVNMCKNDRAITFTNALNTLEFKKQDENGQLLPGGEFKLQKNINGVFLDKPVRKISDGTYRFDADSADFKMTSKDGLILISGLETGTYRIYEISPPEGYKKSENSSSKEVVISDKDSFKSIELINRKENIKGGNARAYLFVTVTTGRNVIPYGLVIGILIIGLITFIVIRNKNKK